MGRLNEARAGVEPRIGRVTNIRLCRLRSSSERTRTSTFASAFITRNSACRGSAENPAKGRRPNHELGTLGKNPSGILDKAKAAKAAKTRVSKVEKSVATLRFSVACGRNGSYIAEPSKRRLFGEIIRFDIGRFECILSPFEKTTRGLDTRFPDGIRRGDAG